MFLFSAHDTSRIESATLFVHKNRTDTYIFFIYIKNTELLSVSYALSPATGAGAAAICYFGPLFLLSLVNFTLLYVNTWVLIKFTICNCNCGFKCERSRTLRREKDSILGVNKYKYKDKVKLGLGWFRIFLQTHNLYLYRRDPPSRVEHFGVL